MRTTKTYHIQRRTLSNRFRLGRRSQKFLTRPDTGASTNTSELSLSLYFDYYFDRQLLREKSGVKPPTSLPPCPDVPTTNNRVLNRSFRKANDTKRFSAYHIVPVIRFPRLARIRTVRTSRPAHARRQHVRAQSRHPAAVTERLHEPVCGGTNGRNRFS